MGLFESQRAYLKAKPDAYLEELKHFAEELRHTEDFSLRAATEINLAACVTILEERQESHPSTPQASNTP